jgi:hypothetical protein
MDNKKWGHCMNCKYFSSPAERPLSEEEARCLHPALSQYDLAVFGSCGCRGFELRAGVSEETEQVHMIE